MPDAEAEREPWHCICSEVTCQAGQPKGVKHTFLNFKQIRFIDHSNIVLSFP